jgi:hypothetical protein
MHIGWVPDGTSRYRGQTAVLVKPNGWFGAAYMAAIKPFRHLLVYPALMRAVERKWQTNPSPSPTAKIASIRVPSSLDVTGQGVTVRSCGTAARQRGEGGR